MRRGALSSREAPPDAQEVTPEPTPVVIGEPPVDVPTVEPFNFWMWLSANSAIVVAAFFGVAMVWQSNQNRKTLKDVLEHADRRSVDAIEAAHEALPEAAQDAFSLATATWTKRGSQLTNDIHTTATGVETDIGAGWTAANLRSYPRTSTQYTVLDTL